MCLMCSSATSIHFEWEKNPTSHGGTHRSVADIISPVDHVPGHRQHAGHPRAAHHPAAHEQRGDVNRLEAEHSADIEVDRLHDVLEAQGHRRGFDHSWGQTVVHPRPRRLRRSDMLECVCALYWETFQLKAKGPTWLPVTLYTKLVMSSGYRDRRSTALMVWPETVLLSIISS